jgi:acyl carrier protein
MDTQTILNELNLIFQDVLKREHIALTNETTARDVDGWDSLTNMQLISQIEKKFNVRFTFRDIVRLKNVGDICQAILTKAQ